MILSIKGYSYHENNQKFFWGLAIIFILIQLLSAEDLNQFSNYPVAGDWNGNGTTKIGVFRNGMWYVDWNGNGVWDAEDAAHIKGLFGQAGDIAVAGK